MNTASGAAVKTLDDLFLRELEEIHDAEHRIGAMLVKMATASRCWKMKRAILNHLLETERHVMKLEQVFGCFELPVTRRTSKAIVGLVHAGAEIEADFGESPAINAALVSFLQKIEHFEIAGYTSLLQWAQLLGNPDAAELLEDILDEEQTAAQTWCEMARSTSNEEALGKQGWEDSEDSEEDEGIRRSSSVAT
ncbi:MAG: DUF892 family protein [Luteolibacter sp.]|uniref:YciE/YciF ferroxidase family protein n=1 Tax=Luteolibacter sp. TaxID=1962973 RepID=UPI0032638A4C